VPLSPSDVCRQRRFPKVPKIQRLVPSAQARFAKAA
jgi:hypothetical protein